ncbi:MAG TPA: DUF1801 domain-containing protein [Bryobacteraceae bacterium]|nr:DUF1801 domain-containing protein [Bryobacteraceae bacterium]HPT26392.1 DUF1801 domain-containing protein [Bryobacteraceae bacterium]
MKSAAPAASVDEYLAAVPDGERVALERIRKAVRAAAPGATETISYGMPAFRYQGLLVGFAAFKNHCSFFPMSTKVMQAHAGELAGYNTSKGAIRFPAAKPLPAALVKRLVRARVAENEAKRPKR